MIDGELVLRSAPKLIGPSSGFGPPEWFVVFAPALAGPLAVADQPQQRFQVMDLFADEPVITGGAADLALPLAALPYDASLRCLQPG
jgi:hypothetical protein